MIPGHVGRDGILPPVGNRLFRGNVHGRRLPTVAQLTKLPHTGRIITVRISTQTTSSSHQQRLHDVSVDVCEPEVASLKLERQLRVVHAETA